MKLTRRALLGALGASGVSAAYRFDPDRAAAPGAVPGERWITYRSCEGAEGPVRIKGVVIGGALLAQQECQIDLARAVLVRGPLPKQRQADSG